MGCLCTQPVDYDLLEFENGNFRGPNGTQVDPLNNSFHSLSLEELDETTPVEGHDRQECVFMAGRTRTCGGRPSPDSHSPCEAELVTMVVEAQGYNNKQVMGCWVWELRVLGVTGTFSLHPQGCPHLPCVEERRERLMRAPEGILRIRSQVVLHQGTHPSSRFRCNASRRVLGDGRLGGVHVDGAKE